MLLVRLDAGFPVNEDEGVVTRMGPLRHNAMQHGHQEGGNAAAHAQQWQVAQQRGVVHLHCDCEQVHAMMLHHRGLPVLVALDHMGVQQEVLLHLNNVHCHLSLLQMLGAVAQGKSQLAVLTVGAALC